MEDGPLWAIQALAMVSLVSFVAAIMIAVILVARGSRGAGARTRRPASGNDAARDAATLARINAKLTAREGARPVRPGTRPEPIEDPRFDPGPRRTRAIGDWDIVYVDRDGVITERRIAVRGLYGVPYPRYARAWCHLRRETRHFRLDRIDRATDVMTGAPVPVTAHLLDWVVTRWGAHVLTAPHDREE